MLNRSNLRPGLGAVAFVALLALGACLRSQTFALAPAERTPGALGEVEVKRADNDNSEVRLKVQHLPEPGQLDPSLRTYVVWIDPGVGRPEQALGQLQLNNNREATITTKTPFSSFDVFVTAETTPTPQQPSPYVVLEGRVNQLN